MLESASVVTIDEADANDMSFDAHPVENMPTTPSSTFSSDRSSVTTIESVVIEATNKLDARDIAFDAEVIAALPPTARIVRASDLSTSHSSRTIRLDTRSPIPTRPPPRTKDHWTGLHKSYFLKLLPFKIGHSILRGEYNSLVAIDAVLPHARFVPRPLKWGSLSQDADLHFLLTEYHELDSQFLSPSRFATTLANLHLSSAQDSETFGFHVTTHNGQLPQMNRKTATLEEYFGANFRQFLDLEKDVQGPHTPDMHVLSNAVLSKVIPRLLRPLETGGRCIKPMLLHGDTTPANVSTSLYTKGPMMYGPCAFYGHNEYDLQAFVGGKFGVEALEIYRRLVPVSEPRVDFEDRMRLYGLRGLLAESCRKPGEVGWRVRLVEGMRVLVEKYRGGWQGWFDGEGGGEVAQIEGDAA